MKQGQETNQIWTQEAGTDDTQQNPDSLINWVLQFYLYQILFSIIFWIPF